MIAFRKAQKIKDGLSKEASVFYRLLSYFHKQAIDALPLQGYEKPFAEALAAHCDILKIELDVVRGAIENKEGGSNE